MEIVDPGHRGVAALEAHLDAEYRRLYGGATDGEMEAYRPSDFQSPVGAILLVVDGDETVAGGALRRWDDGIGEIKRMWTAPEHRRRGHARRILSALEDVARSYGYRSVRLETGIYQAEAIALYLEAGYEPLDNYGRYADSPYCVSFEKRLASS